MSWPPKSHICNAISFSPVPGQPRGDDRDAMGGIAGPLKRQLGQPPAELRLADPAVAEHHQLDFDDRLDAVALVEEVGAKLSQAIFVIRGGENLDGNAGNASL